ncbi:MAG: TlpA family protein disulfide reductase [Candidatus Obscuribacterales bacterium]|nr:TlpA family protein disulfide reductase [Steroidobacteraceae bacterium]
MKKFLLIGLVGLASGVAAVYIYKQSSVPVQAPALVETTPETTEPAPRELAAVLPQFSLKNRAGEMQSIHSWPDKSLVINFWATWCGPCRREIPLLMDLHRNGEKDGVVVVGIAIDFHDEVVKYADKMKINYPLLIGEQDGMAAADAFGIASLGLPFTVFTDKKARVVALHTGELTAEKNKIILAAVARVNQGELTPDQARVAIAEQLLKLPSTAG